MSVGEVQADEKLKPSKHTLTNNERINMLFFLENKWLFILLIALCHVFCFGGRRG
jgi:hypothetical protein